MWLFYVSAEDVSGTERQNFKNSCSERIVSIEKNGKANLEILALEDQNFSIRRCMLLGNLIVVIIERHIRLILK